jgi:SAM-dependent methyltransferase
MDATGWDARYAASRALWPTEPNIWVRAATQSLQPGHALDVAAGEGRHAAWLASGGWRVDAVDFSRQGLDKGREMARARGVADLITWIESDVVETAPSIDTYDLVVVAYLQLPAGPLGSALRSATAAVRAGGTLVVVGHDVSNLTDGVGGPQDPRVLYGPDDILTHLVGTDLVVERAETARRPVPGAARPALDAVVVARRQPAG